LAVSVKRYKNVTEHAGSVVAALQDR
jgi:hypothetical protein